MSGFVPLQPNAASSVFDLYTFKVNKRDSVFVAATNCFGDRSRGSATRWVPNSFETLGRAAILDTTGRPILPATNIDKTFADLDKVGFATVDAAFADTGNNVWFFSGTQCVLVDVDADQPAFTPSHNIMGRMELPPTSKLWNCRRCPSSPRETEANFFCGTKYVHVDFRQDTVLEGPANIATRFPALL